MPTTGRVRGYLWVNILTPWADSSMLFRSERHALLFLFINHASRMLLRSFWLILRRTNKLFRKGVDSFSTLPIMRLHTAGVISSAGRAPPLQGGGRRFDPVITHHFGSLAQLVEQLTFNQLVAGSNPARPTNVKKRPKGAFLLCAKFNNSNLRQVRVKQSETTEPLAATARRASKASYPASHHTYSLHPYCCFCTPRPPPLKHASSLIQRIVSSARGQRISLFTHDFP